MQFHFFHFLVLFHLLYIFLKHFLAGILFCCVCVCVSLSVCLPVSPCLCVSWVSFMLMVVLFFWENISKIDNFKRRRRCHSTQIFHESIGVAQCPILFPVPFSLFNRPFLNFISIWLYYSSPIGILFVSEMHLESFQSNQWQRDLYCSF